MKNTQKKTFRLGDLLLNMNKIKQEQLTEALNEQKNSGQKLGEILIDKGYISENEILEALSYQMGFRIINLENYEISQDACSLISESMAKRCNAVPVKLEGAKLVVAMSDPLNIFNVEDIEMASGKKIEIVLASKLQIQNAIQKYMGRQIAEKAAEDFSRQNEFVDEISLIDQEIISNVSNAPVVRLMNSLIQQALKMGASDIHIEPFETKLRVRFRVDGDLQEILTPSKNTMSALVTRVKIIAGLNIAEKRLPQDGRVEMKFENSAVDVRVSILPTVYGEKIVMRLLDRGDFLKSRQQLGFTEENVRTFDEILNCPNGVILVTGPTGSGKTTTLYSVLNRLNSPSKNIITVEDPVEYKIDGINQVQVNEKAGMTFSAGLRSILRQDPDIIMVGEIRDEETAEIAIRAAITGHLVISTIHTNDAPSTIMRLFDMNIKPFLVATSLRGVVAQRLVKKICHNCEMEYMADDYEKSLLGVTGDVKLHKGNGCPKCYNTGYSGRTAIHEIMKIDSNIREMIYKKSTIDEISLMAQKNGMKTLKENCKELVLSGITTMEEYSQVMYTLD